jgi:hypothetical protein
MEQIFLLSLAGLTSLAGYVLGLKGLRLSGAGFWPAIGRACECVGVALAFFLLNLGVGMGAILAVRALTGRFVSIYLASDITLLIVSLLQALTFQAWREADPQRPMSDSAGSELVHRDP